MNNVIIKLKKDEVCIDLSKDIEYKYIIQELKEKVIDLKKFYKEDKTPITITGRALTSKEFDEIRQIIVYEIDTNVQYEKPKSMGLHSIQNVYEKDSEITSSKFIKGSLRSGQKIEHIGSLIILGDVNSGAEVIASENIVVVGNLRGIAHAGARGNKKSFISAGYIESPQLRIANVVTSFDKTKVQSNIDASIKTEYAYIKDNNIVIE